MAKRAAAFGALGNPQQFSFRLAHARHFTRTNCVQLPHHETDIGRPSDLAA
jgi:hypothetical protein